MASTRRLIVSRRLSVNFLHQTLLILEPSSSEIVSISTTAGAATGATAGATAGAGSTDGAVNKSSANTLILGESAWELIIAIVLAGSFLVMK
jgi:hypothetical protein